MAPIGLKIANSNKGNKRKSNLADVVKKPIDHVFLINSPITAMVAAMYVDHFSIPMERIFCLSFRRTPTDLLSASAYEMATNRYDQLIARFFGVSASGYLTRLAIEKRKKDFILYGAWSFVEFDMLRKSEFCKHHVYLEEGQQTYYPSTPFDPGSISERSRQRRIRHDIDLNYFYRDDALAFIGILNEAFPSVDPDKRLILNNFEYIKCRYNFELLNISAIGISPAPHRIPHTKWRTAMDKFLEKMPEGVRIKLHPGFNLFPALTTDLARYVSSRSEGRLRLCGSHLIIEAELLAGSKCLYGQRSSVQRYAEAFGSTYECLDFDDYIPPKN